MFLSYMSLTDFRVWREKIANFSGQTPVNHGLTR